MSKWRPVDNCLYVIPDIHGMYYELQLILSRILPLRKNAGHHDHLVFLGDYIDRKYDSHKVLDLVCEVKEDYPDQVFCLRGNHEQMFQQVMEPGSSTEIYKLWMFNGGEETLVGYMNRTGEELSNPYLFPRQRIRDLVPKEHVHFLKSLLPYHETDDFIFVHGGCDPFKPLSQQSSKTLCWDRSMYHQMCLMEENKGECPWEKTIVTGHNSEPSGLPLIMDKYMMLDGSYAEILYVWEMNTRTGFWAKKGNKRLVKV